MVSGGIAMVKMVAVKAKTCLPVVMVVMVEVVSHGGQIGTCGNGEDLRPLKKVVRTIA